ncbi:hypothetical protein T439DRAFT_301042 [Meredithblackwellia eburnea MCA 4105]
MVGKVRTTNAHGPTAAKKAVKAPNSAKPTTTTISTAKKLPTSISKPSQTPKGTQPRKRKADEEEPEKPQVVNSLLNAPEEIDFPRGGGTTLTQIEVREAQLEGEKEAQDEEEAERKLNTEVVKDKSKAKRRKLERELAGNAIKEKNMLPKDAFRVEHLNYKRLIPGTKVLAQIILVRPLELIVSLPNQLLAHIPITNISQEFTQRLEAAGEDSSEDEEDSEEEDGDEDGEDAGSNERLPGLNQLFKEGQWVSAVVTDNKVVDGKQKLGGREGDEAVRASRRVELSLEPEKVNEGIAKGDLKAGFTLTAAVKSVEDHGYILSFGVQSLSSFLKFKDTKNQLRASTSKLHVGQVLACRIKDVSENGRTCNVSVDPVEVAGSTLSSATSITSILPSALVSALVTATLPSGLNVKFFGYYDGTIDPFHLNGLDPEKDFKAGQKVKARVMWDSLATTPKKFSLSLAKQVVGLEVAKFGEEGRKIDEVFPVGRILEEIKVTAMDEEWGLSCEIEEDDEVVPAFVHISRITDDHLASLPKAGPYQIGSVHRARVIGYSAVDGLVQLSLQPSVLEQAFLRVSDVKVGDVIKGTVKRLGDSALFVSISGNVDGVVWPLHYSDIRLKHPEKKFKEGSPVKARIYSADPVKNRVVLTLKKQLIESELPIVAQFSDAKVGTITHGTVTKILDKGVLVDFFGGLRALIPTSEAAETFTTDLSRLFTVGKVIPVKIISADPSSNRIVASARQGHDAPPVEVTSVDIGHLSSGTITALHETNVVLTLQPTGVKALMSYATLARHRKTTVDALRNELAKGQTVEELVVVSKNAEKGIVIVGLIPSKASKAEGSSKPANITFASLVVGQKLTGRVSGKVPTGLLVQVSPSVRGRAPPTEISDDFATVETTNFAKGTQVKCVVISLDSETERVELSLRPSRLEADVEVRDPIVASVEDLKPGQGVRGFVKNIANAGLFVSLGGDVTARVLIKELFDEYVKDWKSRFLVNQLVEGKITSVNKAKNQVEMSLRKHVAIKESPIELGALVKGQIVRGVIKRLEAFGAFIRIEGSEISGLCHKSKVTDDDDEKWTEVIHEGDKVRAIITDVNLETKKVSFGLKQSLFPKDDEDSQAESEQDEDEEMARDDDEVTEDDEDEGEEFEGNWEDDSEVELEGSSEPEIQIPAVSTSKTTGVSSVLSAAGGLNWDGESSDDEKMAVGEDRELEGNNDDVEEETVAVALPAKKKVASLKDVANQQGGPSTMGEFEKAILETPNSSRLWIQYIAFFISLSQYDQARSVGRRALRSINFREEQEKLNVWVALLNLENSHGTEASLEELFKEAAQSNDSKTVHLRLVDIFERSEKYEAEEDLFQRTVKKFSQSSKVWTLFGQFYLARGRPEDARELLPRSLKSLEKRKHVKTISKFAQLEFKYGDAERGRTIFEGIVDSYPNRLDLWFVYVDMEIKQKNVTGVRALFDRILAQKLSSKKGKSVFKKWLAFEKENGDVKGVEACKARALAFVESLQ